MQEHVIKNYSHIFLNNYIALKQTTIHKSEKYKLLKREGGRERECKREREMVERNKVLRRR